MLSFFSKFAKKPKLNDLSLKSYCANFTLANLVLGVDNIHIDVYISPQLRQVLSQTAFLIVVKHARAEYYFPDYKRDVCEEEKDFLKNLCADVLQDAVNRARMENESQLDHLAQAALAKMFLEEIKIQHKYLTDHFEQLVRTRPLSSGPPDVEGFKTQGKLAEIKLQQNRIIRRAGKELFGILTDVQTRHLRSIREIHFSPDQILPDAFFDNPVLHTHNATDDFFLTEEYMLFGKRSRDPDNYKNVKSILYDLWAQMDPTANGSDTIGQHKTNNGLHPSAENGNILPYDAWIMETGNIDIMFNYLEALDKLKNSGQTDTTDDQRRYLKQQIRQRKHVLNFFYAHFKKTGLINHMMAASEIKALCGVYCPPMAPREIREFLINFWTRRTIKKQMKRRKSPQGGALPLAPLTQALRWIRSAPATEKKMHLMSFLREFSRYHRDLYNASLLQNAMDALRLVSDEKILKLSKGNRSLYEFLLPAERVTDDKPIKNHVILKADIRGSIQINHTMKTRGLNPASHFSLNFFDPISGILDRYDASKVFIEGDAIILSIFEHEDTPEGWYSVSRACGLAIRIQQIVQRYNIKNQENNLPILELGIGICYTDGPPSYLFDGDASIMISPAINMADRLSACSRRLKKRFHHRPLPYNLYVYKNIHEDTENNPDDISLRYNVNGIELDDVGFAKLGREINLRKTDCKMDGGGKDVQLYTGKVPLLNGQYQKLVIRETPIYEIDPDTLRMIRETPKKYYEICANPALYDAVIDE